MVTVKLLYKPNQIKAQIDSLETKIRFDEDELIFSQDHFETFEIANVVKCLVLDNQTFKK